MKRLSEDLLVVDLPGTEPRIEDKLSLLNEAVSRDLDCNIIIDFSRVEMLISASVSNLIILRKLLSDRGRKLILFSVPFPTRCIFTVAGITSLFNFVEDKPAALEAIDCLRTPA